MRAKTALRALGDLNEARFDSLLNRVSSLRVVVIGDYFLDKYLDIDPSLVEISLETGRQAHQAVGSRHSPGAAGNVAANVAALGVGWVGAIGFRGEDGEGWELEHDLAAMGVDSSGLFVAKGRRTPTYLKSRVVGLAGLRGELDRIDTKNRDMTARGLEEQLVSRLEACMDGLDVLLVTDQVEDESSGVVTPFARNAILGLVKQAKGKIHALADSRRRIDSFGGLVLKMNSREFRALDGAAAGDAHDEALDEAADDTLDEALDEADLGGAIAALEARTGSPVFVTAGKRGAWIGGADPGLVPGLAIEGPVDPTGAGDSFTAGSALALAAGASFAEAALFGCLASSQTVRQLGRTGVPSRAGLRSAFGSWRAQQA